MLSEDNEGTEVDLSGIVPDHWAIYEGDDGLFTVDPETDERYNVEREDADDDDEALSAEEEALAGVFIDAADGDYELAAASYASWENRMASSHDGQQDQATYTPSEFNSWMAAHPAVEAAGVDEFLPYVHRADGNLDAAYELFSYNLDNLREAAEKEGHRVGPKVSMKDALDDAFSERLLGSKAKTYEHRATGDAMDDALGGFQEILSIKNAVRDQARGRVRKLHRPG